MTNATVNVTVTDANGLSAQMGTIIYVTTGGGGGGTGGTTIPSGVTQQAIDGGPTYYATGYNDGSVQVPFSYAAASVTNNGVTYAAGWDDPKFFPMGNFQIRISTSGTVTMFNNLNWNYVFFLNTDTDLTMVNNAGISQILSNAELFDTLGGGAGAGILSVQSPPLTAPPSHCISVTIDDEPGGPSNAITDPIAGIQTLRDGTHVSGTTVKITNAIQDGRIFLMGASGATSLAFGNICSVTWPNLMINTYPTPNSIAGSAPRRRSTDIAVVDFYHMSTARRATPLTTSNRGWGASAANAYLNQGTAFYESYLQMAKASHQGDFVDYLRQYTITAGTTTRPLSATIQIGTGRTNIPYEISFTEFNWECWTVIIHGARMLLFFDHTDATGADLYPNDPSEAGPLSTSYATTNRTVSFTGSISVVSGVATLTVAAGAVTGFPATGYYLQPGMQITSGATGVPTIAAQLTFVEEAAFTASYSSGGDRFNVPITTSGVTGTIPVPSIFENVTHPADQDTCLTYTANGTGTPTYSAGVYNGYNFFGTADITASGDSCKAWHPGMAGTYLLSGYTGGNVSGVSMTAKQPNNISLGNPVTNTGAGTIFNQVTTTCAMVKSLAPIINSPFALNYIKAASSFGYCFPSNTVNPQGTTIPTTQTSGALTYGTTSTGLDCCVKYYTGSTYTAVTGDSIVGAFYIIATTRCTEDTINTSISITINDPLATSLTVIGEGRTITFDSGQGTSSAVFHDTFAFAWTVHIYRVNH